VKKDKDSKREPTGALFFSLSGFAASVSVAALFSVAGFLLFIPFLNLAAAILFCPLAFILIYKPLLRKTRLQPIPARVITAFVSGAGAYVFICVMTGTLSAIFGQAPIENEYLRDAGLTLYLFNINIILGNGAHYLFFPARLWQDLAAWHEGGWTMLAASALTAQIILPQVFIERRAR
jgi:hypothetical protein